MASPRVPGTARLGGGLRNVLVVSFLVFAVYQLALVLVPYQAALSGHGEFAAGTLTATFMAGAVAGPLAAHRFFAGGRIRTPLGWALVVHAVATVALAFEQLPVLLAANAIRGVTFGVIAAGLPVAVVHAASSRAGAALGLWGAVCTAPAVFVPTVAVWMTDATSPMVLMGVAAVATLVATVPLGAAAFADTSPSGDGQRTRIEPTRYLGPALVFLIATAMYGAVVSFAPLFLHEEASVERTVAFLLAMGIAIPAGRLAGGVTGRWELWLPFGSALSIAGVLTLVAWPQGWSAVAGGAAYGLGFGIATTISQLLLLGRSQHSRPEDGSVVFSALFNAGIGIGGLAMGGLAELMGLAAGFVALAVASALILPLAHLVGREGRDPRTDQPVSTADNAVASP